MGQSSSTQPPPPEVLWCGRNKPCAISNNGMDCSNRILGYDRLKQCPSGYDSSFEKGSCFLPDDRQRKCTIQRSKISPVNPKYPGPGYCISDPNNKSFFILKTENTSGWGPGQNCWVTDGTVTGYGGKKPCAGGSLDECKRRIDGNGNVFFTELDKPINKQENAYENEFLSRDQSAAFPMDLGRKIADCCQKRNDRSQLECGNLYDGAVSNQPTCLALQNVDRCMRSLDSLLTPTCVDFCTKNNSLCNSIGKSDPKKFFGVN